MSYYTMQNQEIRVLDDGQLHKIVESIYNQIDSIIPFAQGFSAKPLYSIKNAKSETASTRTVYRRLHDLNSVGLANFRRGVFEIKRGAILQPAPVLKKLIPSLIALKNGRRFGRYYNELDINFAKKQLPEKFLTTLDYAAWELTKFQTPSDFFIYVNDMDKASEFLKNNKFSEGNSGHVVLLPKIGNFINEVERVYLDCIANDGRSLLDAIALELLYGDYLSVKGQFPIEYVKKVQEDMPKARLVHE